MAENHGDPAVECHGLVQLVLENVEGVHPIRLLVVRTFAFRRLEHHRGRVLG